MGASSSHLGKDTQHCGCHNLDPKCLEGTWWVLARCPDKCDDPCKPCGRETVDYTYDCVSMTYQVIVRKYGTCDEKNLVVESHSLTHTFRTYDDLIMPAKLVSENNDKDEKSEVMSGCHTVHFVDECFAVIEGHKCDDVWVLSRREVIKDTEVGTILSMVKKHGLNCSCLEACRDAVVKDEDCAAMYGKDMKGKDGKKW